MTMLEGRERVSQDRIFKDTLSLIPQQRSEGSFNDPQPFDFGPETPCPLKKMTIESTQINIQQGQSCTNTITLDCWHLTNLLERFNAAIRSGNAYLTNNKALLINKLP